MRIALIAVLVLAAAAGGFFIGRRGVRDATAAPDAEQDAQDAEASSHRVSVARLRRASLTRRISVFGTVAAAVPRVVSSPIDAEVARLPAVVGSRVEQGDLLAELIPTPATRAARAEAFATEVATSRALALVEQRLAAGLATMADRQQSEQAASAARRVAEEWRVRLPGDVVDVRADGVGVVVAVSAAAGQWIAAGAEIARLTAERVARFGLEPADAAAIAQGSSIAVRAPRRGDVAPMDVRVTAVSGTVDAESHLVDAIATLPNDAPFAVGEALVTDLAIATPAALIVPRDAIDPAQGGSDGGIFIVVEGHAHLHPIAIVATAGDEVAIAGDGITEGDEVAITGVHALADGDAVEAPAAADPTPPIAAPAAAEPSGRP